MSNHYESQTEAEFVEGGVYRAVVRDVRNEISKKYPGWNYPRVMLIAYEQSGRTKPVSWIPWEREEVVPAIRAINPNFSRVVPGLVGVECCVRISLRRGVTARKILPATYLSTPTLAAQGLLETKDTDFCDVAPKAS